MAGVALEIGFEVAEIGEIVAESADIAEVAAEAADTTAIVSESIDAELSTTMETSLDASIGEEVNSAIGETVDEEISGELQQVIDESTSGTDTAGEGETDPGDDTEGESGKTKSSMLQVIKKWGHRILNTYMLMDMVGKQIMKIVDAAKGHGPGQPKLTAQELQDLNDLSTAVQKMSLMYQSLHQSITLISESTDFLGNEMVTAHASVKQIFDSILIDIKDKFKLCHAILARSPFTSTDVKDLGNAVYHAVLKMGALFQIRSKSKALTAFQVPSDKDEKTLDSILKLKFLESRNMRIKKIEDILKSPTTMAHAKSAAISAGSATIHADVVAATRAATIKKYHSEVKEKAKSAAKDAGKSAAEKYIPQYIGESAIPFVGSMLAGRVKDHMKSAAKDAAKSAANKAIKSFFKSKPVKEEIAKLAREETQKYASLKHKEIVAAADRAVKRTLKTALTQAHIQ